MPDTAETPYPPPLRLSQTVRQCPMDLPVSEGETDPSLDAEAIEMPADWWDEPFDPHRHND